MEARIDKWLWAVRLYKTRSLATDACKNGRITINGAPAKPSKTVHDGDTVTVRKPPVTYTFRVLQAIENRVGAKLVPEMLEMIKDALQYVTKVAEEEGVELKTVSKLGKPAESIIEEAANHQLVICGSHGRTGLSRTLIGSVAEKVVRLAPCPVLVVRLQNDKKN